jgi:hypothetical protein
MDFTQVVGQSGGAKVVIAEKPDAGDKVTGDRAVIDIRSIRMI